MWGRRLAVLVAAATLAGVAAGQDAPPTDGAKRGHDLAVPPQWRTGECVTTTVSEERRQVTRILRKDQPEKTSVEEEKLAAEFVLRCDEAAPDGRFLRGTVFVRSWRRTATGAPADTTAKGAVLALGGGAWTRVVGTATLSEAARAWLDQSFPKGEPADHSAADRFAGVPRLAAGETREADVASIEKDLPPAQRRIDPRHSYRKLTLVSADLVPEGRKVTVLDESHLDMSGGKSPQRATGISTRSRFSGVLPLWHRTAEEATTRTTRSTTDLPGIDAGVEETRTRTRTSRPGGTVPEIPAPAPQGPAPAPGPPGGK